MRPIVTRNTQVCYAQSHRTTVNPVALSRHVSEIAKIAHGSLSSVAISDTAVNHLHVSSPFIITRERDAKP